LWYYVKSQLCKAVHDLRKKKLAEIVRDLRGERSQRDFAGLLSVSQPTVQSWESGKGANLPTLENIEKLAAIANKPLEDLLSQLLDRPLSFTSNVIPYEGDYVKIPIVAAVGAGGGANPQLEVIERFISLPADLITKHANPKYVHALEVMGDSMAPTLHSGDLVLIDTQKIDVSSGVYVFVYEGDTYVKRLARLGRKISITSDNPAYLPQELSSGDIDFRVLGKTFFSCQYLG
jgi:phage repressor protein C with HTH and peptisase S24 domain